MFLLRHKADVVLTSIEAVFPRASGHRAATLCGSHYHARSRLAHLLPILASIVFVSPRKGGVQSLVSKDILLTLKGSGEMRKM